MAVLDADSAVPRRRRIRAGAVARKVISRLRGYSISQHSPVTLSILKDPEGLWDPELLEKLFSALIHNAIKFGAGQPVTVTLDLREEALLIEVEDKGPGIRQEDQERIFQRFERAVPTNHFGGLGVGLFIARKVVEAHDGSMTVHSRPGEGATFSVVLPHRATPGEASPFSPSSRAVQS